MNRKEDDELIRLCCAGDAGAFRDLLDRYYDTIFKMAYHLSGHREDAEDLTQMACLKIAQNIQSFRQDSKFTTWIYTIVLNTFRDWVGSKKKHVPLEKAEELRNADNPEKDAQVSEQMRQLNTLPDQEREAVVLVFGQGFSHKEAADLLGCAESTISWRVHEARKKLSAMGERI